MPTGSVNWPHMAPLHKMPPARVLWVVLFYSKWSNECESFQHVFADFAVRSADGQEFVTA